MTTPPAPGPDVVRAIVAEAQAPRPRTRPRASDGSRYTPAPRPAEKRCRRCGPRGGVSPAKLAARRALEPTTILHDPADCLHCARMALGGPSRPEGG